MKTQAGPIQFGVQLRNFPSGVITEENIFEKIGEVGSECDSLHYDSLWTIDHLMMRPPLAFESQSLPDCWITLAYLAEKTKRIHLGSLVSCVLLREQEFLGRLSLSIDEIASGRLKVGLGSGWFEDEFHAFGIEFPSAKTRSDLLARTAEYLLKLRKSQRLAGPEIWIGGSGERRTLKLVAELADACSLFGDPETVARKVALVRQYRSTREHAGPSKLIVSKQSNVLLGQDSREVEHKLLQIIPDQTKWKYFVQSNIVGTPEECRKQIGLYVQAGVEYFTLNFPDVFEIEPLRDFDELVIRTLDQDILA